MLTKLFDAEYYRRQVNLGMNPADLLAHFREVGDESGFDPTPYFSTRWYKLSYPDWAKLGAGSAIEDFLLRVGRGEARQPHPLIDPDHYRRSYPDLAGLGASAALHFMLHGDGEGRSPSTGFDATFYRRCYLPLGATHPFRNYVTLGGALGDLPRPLLKSADASRDAMQILTTALGQPFVLVSHDAQAAGVPILTLDFAEALRARGWQPVFLLGNAGPLLQAFKQLGPVFILAEGWDVGGLAAGLRPGTPALINTAVAAHLAAPLAHAGLSCLVLIHEMAEFIGDQGLIPDLKAARNAGAGLVVSMPNMARQLVDDFGEMEQIRPGIVLPETPLAAFRQVRQELRSHYARGPVFISAGHGDRRKGFDLFLEAANAITRRIPAARFVWLGVLDAWAQRLAEAARAKGLALVLPGFVADSLAWYRAADVYLLTSRQDPGPTTAIHAVAVGTPFIGYSYDIGLIGITEGMGQFVPPGDVDTYTREAISMVAANSPASRRHRRRLVRSECGFPPYVDEILKRLDHGRDAAT